YFIYTERLWVYAHSLFLIFYISTLINDIEDTIIIMKENQDKIDIVEKDKKEYSDRLNKLNTIIYVSIIMIWLLTQFIFALINQKSIFNDEYIMHLTFLIPVSIVVASVQGMFINYLLNPIKSDLKIYKMYKNHKTGMLRRNVIIMVFIPVTCISFGINYNYKNMLNSYEGINNLRSIIILNNENNIERLKPEWNKQIKEYNNTLQQSFIFNIIFGAILVLIVSVILFLSNTEIKKRISMIMDKLKSVISGEKINFDEKFTIVADDEIGQLSQQMNMYMQIQNHNISNLKHMQLKIGEGFNTLDNSVVSLKDLSGDIDSLKDDSIQYTTSYNNTVVNKTNSYIEEVIGSINEINEKLSEHIDKSEESTNKIKETVKNLEQTETKFNENLNSMSGIISKAVNGTKAMSKHINVMSELSEYSDSVVEIIETINSISKKTNLLAMNASIEAAHAGEKGKGFAVVAEEIRKLAETSNNNIKEITSRMESLAEKIELSSQTVSVAGDSFKDIYKDIKNVNNSFKEIYNIIDKETSNIAEISNTVQQLNNIGYVMKELSNKHKGKDSENVDKLKQEIMKISENLYDFNSRLEEDNQKMKERIERLNNVTQDNKKIINRINEYTNLFQLDTSNSRKYILEGNTENNNIQNQKSKLPTIREEE
ncbi:MAG: methyl-accepting chemotaxis protein, partial [Spirochaetota bacterium]